MKNDSNYQEESYFVRFMRTEVAYRELMSGGNTLEALKILKHEAADGTDWAAVRIGEYYLNSKSTEYSDKGLDILFPLSDKSHYVQYILANYYFSKKDSSKNELKLAKKLLKLSAESGMVDAQFYIAQLYRKGQYFKKNLKKAFKYYKEAAKKAHKKAKKKLAKFYKKDSSTRSNKSKSVNTMDKIEKSNDGLKVDINV